MEMVLVATNDVKTPGRMAGSYQAAWRVTVGDKTGFVVHSFRYDKRDIMDEQVIVEENIADAMKAEIDDEWWDPASDGFCDTGERVENNEMMDQALKAVTITLYDVS